MIHPLADVQTASIGTGTDIWQFSVVLKGAVIGKNCNINCNCFIENDVVIGNNVTVKAGVQLWDGLRVEDNVFIGPNTTFTNDLVPRSKIFPERFIGTTLKKGCSIGANTTILAGVTIGEYAFVGAGSLVTKGIPPYTMWYGHPAKHKGYITEQGIILDLHLNDKMNGDKYLLSDHRPVKQ